MNKNLKKLLALAAMSCFSHVSAETALNIGKTSALSNIKMQDFYHDVFSLDAGMMSAKKANSENADAFGGTFKFHVGYQGMFDGTRGAAALGKGLGMGGKNSVTFSSEANDAAITDIISTWSPAAYNAFTQDGGTYGKYTLTFLPKQKRAWAHIGYCHDLTKFYEGMYFSISTDVLYVNNEVNATEAVTTNMKATTTGTAGGAGLTALTAADATLTAITHYAALYNKLTPLAALQGTNSAATHVTNGQAELKYGKLTNEKSKIGVNNVRVALGIKVIDTENFTGCIAIDGAIPTGLEEKGESAFAQRVGDRNAKIGAHACGHACLMDGSDYTVSLDMSGLWHYNFQRKGLRLPSCTNKAYGHYALALPAAFTKGVVPAPIINYISGMDMTVKPGHNFNGNLALGFEKGSFNFGAGYGFEYQTDEKNSITNQPDLLLVGTAQGTGIDPLTTLTKVVWANHNFDHKAKASHHFNASVGMNCKDCQYPYSLSIFAGYKFAHNDSITAQPWDLGIRGSVSF